MMMIEKVMGIDFVKDVEITNIKPQALTAPTITMDVPSISAAPCSMRSRMGLPPPTSSSTGGISRVLKSMLCVCQDTRQCQDVLGLNEFPLPEPPLDEDPFAFLTPTDSTAMGDAPATADDDGSKYKDGNDDDECLLSTMFFLFPFLCLDVKGGEEYISMLLVHCFYWIWLIRH
jgi:hypothetical protein